MNTLLWTLAIVGVWNFISMLARVYEGVYWFRYWWSVVLGMWASYLLFMQ